MMHVSHNFRCDTETRELGEDYPELKRIERAYRILERVLERAATRVNSRRAIRTVLDLGAMLPDVRHDASLGSTLSEAEDAYSEALVRPIRQTALLRIVT